MNNRLHSITLIVALMLPINHVGAEDDGKFTLTSGLDYSSGKYGQSKNTNITYIPMTGKYETDQWTLKLTIPWLEITGPSGVSGDSRIITHQVSNKITTTSGVGDVVASATYSGFQFNTQKIYIDFGAKLKLPTASESKGLGTGEYDYAFSADIYKIINQLTWLGTVGYKKLGDSNSVNLNNVWFGTVGAVYKFNPQNSAGLTVDVREPTSKSSTKLREYTLFYSHKFNQTYKLQTYLVTGDTQSSTDLGGGAMLGVSW